MLRLSSSDPGFGADFAALVAARRESDSDVSAQVSAIIADVRVRGDAVLAELGKPQAVEKVRGCSSSLAQWLSLSV